MTSTLDNTTETSDDADDAPTKQLAETSDDTTPPAEPTPSLESAPAEPKAKRSTLRRWMRRLVIAGLLVPIVVIAAVASWPTIKERVIQPVETAAEDLDAVQIAVDANSARLDTLEGDLANLQSETGALARTDASVEQELALVDEALSGLTSDLDAQSDVADELSLAAGVDEIEREILRTEVSNLEAELTRESALNSSAMLMLRARLSLYESNYGLATTDMETARAILEKVTADDAVAETIVRLDRAIENLPDRPVAAAADLDIAWQVLAGELTAIDSTDSTDAAADASPDTAVAPAGADEAPVGPSPGE